MIVKGKKRSASPGQKSPSKPKSIKVDKTKDTNSKPSKPHNLFKGKPSKALADAKPEKTDWNKFKKEKKELKMKRKQTKDSYEVTVEAKKIYEQLKK